MPTGFYTRSKEQIERLKSIGFKKGMKPLHTFPKGNTMRKGVKLPKEVCKRISEGHKGLKHSIISCAKRSMKMRGIKRPQTTGSKNGRWNGGSSKECIRYTIEYRLWRESVFARDNWTCCHCKKQGIFLHAHHIKKYSEFPKLRLAIDNGITLCKECHQKLHPDINLYRKVNK